MMKRYVAGIVLLTGMALFLWACERGTEPEVAPVSDIAAEEVTPKAGKLHNSVIEAFYEEHPGATRLSAPDFVAAMTRAANVGLSRTGFDEAVTMDDLESIIVTYLEIRDGSGYDLLSPRNSDPVLLVDYAEGQGWITAREAELLRQFIESSRGPGIGAAPSVGRERVGSDMHSDTIDLFFSVYHASEELWPSVHARYGGPVLDDPVRSLGSKLVDGIAVLAKLHPIWRIIGCAISSVLFEQAYDAGAFDGYRDPCTPCWLTTP